MSPLQADQRGSPWDPTDKFDIVKDTTNNERIVLELICVINPESNPST